MVLVAACNSERLDGQEKRIEALEARVREVVDLTESMKGAEYSTLHRLDRLDGIKDLGVVRGWWCVDGLCGRTRGECVRLARRALSASLDRIDSDGCVPLDVVWCPPDDREGFECRATRCPGCEQRR